MINLAAWFQAKKSPQTLTIPYFFDKQLNCTRYFVKDNGDCGYLAFGIERKQAMALFKTALKGEQADRIINILRDAVRDELLTEEFLHYLQDKNLSTTPLAIAFNVYFEPVTNNIDKKTNSGIRPLQDFANDPEIVLAYLQYDIIDKRAYGGWSHIAVLRALAQIQGIELYIWQVDPVTKERVPHGQYPHLIPVGFDKPERKDLLFVNGNHFELIDIPEEKPAQTKIPLKKLPQEESTMLKDTNDNQYIKLNWSTDNSESKPIKINFTSHPMPLDYNDDTFSISSHDSDAMISLDEKSSDSYSTPQSNTHRNASTNTAHPIHYHHYHNYPMTAAYSYSKRAIAFGSVFGLIFGIAGGVITGAVCAAFFLAASPIMASLIGVGVGLAAVLFVGTTTALSVGTACHSFLSIRAQKAHALSQTVTNSGDATEDEESDLTSTSTVSIRQPLYANTK